MGLDLKQKLDELAGLNADLAEASHSLSSVSGRLESAQKKTVESLENSQARIEQLEGDLGSAEVSVPLLNSLTHIWLPTAFENWLDTGLYLPDLVFEQLTVFICLCYGTEFLSL